MNIQSIIESLSAKRPIFHNEADFQHALAWEIKETLECTVRLERRVDVDSQKFYIDIFVEQDHSKTAIELKYKVRALDCTIHAEQFTLSNQGAQDIGRYDIVKDLHRLEQLVARGFADEGILLLLTNDSSYYMKRVEEKVTADHQFRIHQGITVGGCLEWGISTGAGTMKGRENPIEITGKYKMEWAPYSIVNQNPQGAFNYLAVSVNSCTLLPPVESVLEPTPSVHIEEIAESGNDSPWLESFLLAKPLLFSQTEFRDKLASVMRESGYQVHTNRDLGQMKIDIWAEKGDEIITLEVRYKTASLDTIHNGKPVSLKNQLARDISRYDYVKDIEKLEQIVLKRSGVKGYALLITNDPLYWNKPKHLNNIDAAFHLHHHRNLHGCLTWGEKAMPGTTINREQPIQLVGEYELNWLPYMILGEGKNEEFRILIVEASNELG